VLPQQMWKRADGLTMYGVRRQVSPEMELLIKEPWDEHYPVPKALSKSQIQDLTAAFVAATKRALAAGVDFIEIHSAHGYLLHSFLSPATNTRTDEYGGKSLDNRLRFPLETVRALRKTMPETMPLFYRVSGTDWLPAGQGWDSEQTVELAKRLQAEGVDLLDVSSGGNHKDQQIPSAPGFQVHLAAAVKKSVPNLVVGAVGIIVDGHQANDVNLIFQVLTCRSWRGVMRMSFSQRENF
jgi:2,4-dienoyl-CoA reductase-like NADH-dependent reductase (Old Yellow Enzyme family)